MLVEGGTLWHELKGGSERPTAESSLKQRSWDETICKSKFETLLYESNPDTLSVSAALRIGASKCEPHVCRCGANVNTPGLHNLACRFSAGRLARHTELSDVVRAPHQTSGVPGLLESPGFSRDDGRNLNLHCRGTSAHGPFLIR